MPRVGSLLVAALGVAVRGGVAHAQQIPGGDASFHAEDREAVEAVERAYVAAWLAGDPDAVLALFESDGVLLPDGAPAVRGREAMRRFWWPDGPAVTIERYEVVIEEVIGQGDLAVVRGVGELTFSWRDADGMVQRRDSRSRQLTVMRRGADGHWRIARRMWDGLREP